MNHENKVLLVNTRIHGVTAKGNWPSSYRFTQVNQRNIWTILDWTSQIPLKIMFSSENNL